MNEQGSTATAAEAETQARPYAAAAEAARPDAAAAEAARPYAAATEAETQARPYAMAAEAETQARPYAAAPEAETQPGPDEELNRQITEALSELLKHAHDFAQGIAADFGLTGSDAMALVKLEAPMTMKDLGLKIGCDPSFVTTIADALESHGLARREPSQRDRRSKNIVLTPEGVKVRERICDELSARAPWCTTLDTSERQCLLGLMRKMLRFRERR